MSFTLTPVYGDDFIGRKEVISELVQELSSKNRIGFSISGIRRIGKTSILREVERRLLRERKDIRIIYVSVWRVSPSTVDEFVHVMNRATLAAFENALPARFRFEELLTSGARALGRLLENLKLSSNVTDDLEVSVSYVRGESTDVDAAITKSLSLPEHLSQMTKKKCVLMIDEFPSLEELKFGSKNRTIGESMIKLVRTLYEDFRLTKLVISGSYRDTMENLVTKSKAPFYKQLLLREIGPFSVAEFGEFISHYLADLRFVDDRARKDLYKVSSGIPYNLQLLGKEIRFQNLNLIGSKEIDRTVQSVLAKEGDLSFREFVEDLTPSDVKVLKALAKSPMLKPTEIAAEQFMEDGTVRTSLNQLVKRGTITRLVRGQYGFTDNLFAVWLRRSDEL